MNSTEKGLMWPLALFSVATLGGCLVSLFGLPPEIQINIPLGLALLVCALLSGFILYYPRIWLTVKVPNLATYLENIRNNETQIFDSLDQVTVRLNEVSQRLETIDQTLAALDRAQNAGPENNLGGSG